MDDEAPFEVVLAHLDGFVRVKLRGDLDYPATVRYAEALQEVTDLRDRAVLDLSELDYVDSAGLAFLAGLASAHEGPVRLEHASANVIRMLDLTGLIDRFDVDSS